VRGGMTTETVRRNSLVALCLQLSDFAAAAAIGENVDVFVVDALLSSIVWLVATTWVVWVWRQVPVG